MWRWARRGNRFRVTLGILALAIENLLTAKFAKNFREGRKKNKCDR
jgi:hypothetical protein